MSEVANTHFAVTKRWAAKLLPERAPLSNKSHYGHTLVIGGSPSMWGAGILACLSAYRVGSGYVSFTSAVDANAADANAADANAADASVTNSEVTAALSAHPEILHATDCSLATLREILTASNKKPKFSAVAIGPGLGLKENQRELIKKYLMALKGTKIPVVVDADAITVLASSEMRDLPANWVLTPHAGELSRLLGVSAQSIEENRYFYAVKASQMLGCLVLLKGFHSVLADQQKVYVILSGNASLAKAGTGDTLTGMIAGLMAQNMSAKDAALLGCYLHGRLADEWVKQNNDMISLTALDLAGLMPALIKKLRESKR